MMKRTISTMKKWLGLSPLEDIHNRLLQKDKYLSLQADFSATPKHNNGAIFAQTISDYPLVEAIHQNVVKRPVVPDNASAAKLEEKTNGEIYRPLCRLHRPRCYGMA